MQFGISKVTRDEMQWIYDQYGYEIPHIYLKAWNDFPKALDNIHLPLTISDSEAITALALKFGDRMKPKK